MRSIKSVIPKLLSSGLVVSVLSLSAFAGSFEDFRFPREASVTKDGYLTPLSGKAITKTPVIVKKKGVALKKYPEHYIPGKETLGDNEMRVTVLGSGGACSCS